ncbi:MAG: nicotinamide-nucleotide adenylyltransferase [Roseateles depolymerans]|uniref:Nicotinamide-nucleotide adenylyltransferase n=1 Tax=Roseateles depolymerans TaxID=76731 RepID=A0A2W5DJE9_9BURK|nr:MAG: nicotinamide-nucleotide adenylyltransferase [Roseateles depolymerans]
MSARLIALLGGECTGKTSLGRALAAHFGAGFVPEYLREWCDTHGRTPLPAEQAHIAAEQARRIEQEARRHALVFCDTTPLLTALYSQHYFDDIQLLPGALAWQRGCTLNLLCAPDLPWEPDGVQRDGPQARACIDTLLRQALGDAGLGWTDITGTEGQRLQAAIQALAG